MDERNLWPDTLRVIDEVGPAIVLLENVPGILANGYAGTVVGQLASAGYDALWGLLSAASVGAPHVRARWWCLAYPNRYRAAKSGWGGDCLRTFLGEVQGRQNQADTEDQSTDLDDSSKEVDDSDYSSRRNKDAARWQLQAWTENAGEELGDSPIEGLEGGRLFQTSWIQERQHSLTSQQAYNFPPGPDSPEWAIMPPEFQHLAPATIECKFCGVANGTPHRVERLKALGNGIVPSVVAEFLRRISYRYMNIENG